MADVAVEDDVSIAAALGRTIVDGRRTAATRRGLRSRSPWRRALPRQAWTSRHRGILWIVLLHIVGVAAFAFAVETIAHAVVEVAAIVVFAGAAALGRVPRRLRSVAASLALLVAWAEIVHLSGGVIEAHFGYFLALAIVALYQDQLVYAVAFAFVVAQHGIVGALDPNSVYTHYDDAHGPWVWALVHGGFVGAVSVANVVAWRLYRPLSDGLTGLADRAFFLSALGQAAAKRRGATVGVLFIDVDGFKDVNDTLGHAAGDELLRAVGDRIATAVRHDDLPARLGGDEFAVLLPRVSDEGEAAGIAARIRREVGEPLAIAGSTVAVRASIGIALTDGTARTPEQLLRDADLAMYAAKRGGEGSIRAFRPEMLTRLIEATDLERELRETARTGNGLEVHYQPIVDASGERVGVEALMRWTAPVRGIVAPAVFIPLAEAKGLIGDLGRWVLRSAIRDVASWRSRGVVGRPFALNVNVSARQLEDPTFVEFVAVTLEAARFPASDLVLEITETAVLADVERASSTLEALRALGVRIALDDFGTGYSSLAHVQRLPLDEIKLDRSFVNDLSKRDDHAVIGAVIALAHARRLAVVAEGVEDATTAGALFDLGVDLAQGYHFGRPMRAAAFQHAARAAA